MSNSPKALYNIQIIWSNFISSVPRWNYSHASTPTWRLYWNPGPGAWIRCKNQTVLLDKSIAVLVPPQLAFATGAEQSFPHFYVHFNLPAVVSPEQRQVWQFESRKIILPEWEKLLPEFSPQQLHWAGSAAVNAALLLLPENILLPQSNDNVLTLFEKTCNYLELNNIYNISCPELAQKCFTSVNTLQREFFRATGLPLQKWLLNRRMAKAVQLLLHEQYSIKETAAILDFADRYHFSKVFKNYFGSSPAQFVRQGGLPMP